MVREIYSYPGHGPRNKHARLAVKLMAVVGVVLGGLLIWQLLSANNTSTPSLSTNQTTKKSSTPVIKEVNGRYLFSGTTVLARLVQSYAHGDFSQPFSKMDTFGNFDAREMDLECPVTSSSFSYGGDQNPRFNCTTKWLPFLKKYYRIVKIAGNHTYDMGADGFSQTVKNLQSAGIQAIGHYNPHLNKAHNCEVVALAVRSKYSDGHELKGKLPIAFCAFNYKILFSPEAGEMEMITKYAKLMPVFGLLQAGAEYQTAASSVQQTYARRMIDLGADFVIANGTHYVQNSEAYKGKLIVYSLGNFIFDQTRPETDRGLSIAVDMKINYDENVGKWLALNASCMASTRGDDCLAMAEAKGLTKISAVLKYEPIGNNSGAVKPTAKANVALQKAIETRLGWVNTCRGLVGNICK